MKYLPTMILGLATVVSSSSLAEAQYLNSQSAASQSAQNGAYQQGVQDGQWDAQHGRRADAKTDRYYSAQEQRDYVAGYNQGYGKLSQNDSQQQTRAFQAGMRDGRRDARQNASRNPDTQQFRNRRDQRDYQAGYDRGFNTVMDRNNGPQGLYNPNRDTSIDDYSLSISGKMVSWSSGLDNARVFVQKDNGGEEVFAQGASGNQQAPWLERGHMYTFILRDMSGNELMRKTLDLRNSGSRWFNR